MSENEKYLISCAESWRNSKNWESWALGDNTPFQLIEGSFEYEGVIINYTAKARATKKRDSWVFRAMLRDGYTGDDFDTLNKSLIHAYTEKKKERERITQLMQIRAQQEQDSLKEFKQFIEKDQGPTP